MLVKGQNYPSSVLNVSNGIEIDEWRRMILRVTIGILGHLEWLLPECFHI